MKDNCCIKISHLFNLCEYKIKLNDVTWNKVKMTSSKWITCYHPSYNSGKINKNASTSSSPFNTFDGRKYKWSPSMSSNNSCFTSASPSESSSSSSICSTNFVRKTPTKCDSSCILNRSKDDSLMRDFYPGPSQKSSESIITLINPFEYLLINCETTGETNCAQISPGKEIIAVSNEYWLAFYSIRDNLCLGTVQFPNKCQYWTWINNDTIAIITENDIFHWCLEWEKPLSDYPKLIFSISEEVKNYQIVNYAADSIYGNWFALTALYLDDEGQICGKIQIYSDLYMKSQCIEAHSCHFASYRFDDSSNNSNILIAVKRENKVLWKLYIIELSTIPYGNVKMMKTQHLTFHSKETLDRPSTESNNLPFDDIPTNIVCDEHYGLIFIVSKYGSLYICDLETGVPIYYDTIKTGNAAIFSLSYDQKNHCLIAINRNGIVMAIKILFKKLLECKTLSNQSTNVYNRISEKLKHKKLLQMATISTGDQLNNNIIINDNDDNKRTISIMVNQNQVSSENICIKRPPKKPTNHHAHNHLQHATSSNNNLSYPDLEEEVTRL